MLAAKGQPLLKESVISPPHLEPEELRKRRLELGLTLHQLAALLGVTPTWVSRVERGEGDLLLKPYAVVARYLQVLGLEDPMRQSPWGGKGQKS
jgi:predicted transcriptional regulator